VSRQSDKVVRKVVDADHLVSVLTQKITEHDTDERLLPLQNAKVVGNFDLKHSTIEKPVEIRDSEFEGKVDLRYCEFKQVVDLSGCTFHEEFNSGDLIRSHTIYRKDLICGNSDSRKTVFKKAARFHGARVEGSATFSGARFELERADEPCNRDSDSACTVDFTGAYFGSRLDCRCAVFRGPVSCSYVECGGSAFFNGACFQSKDEVDFTFASFGVNLYCNKAIFRGPVNFERLMCTDSGYFNHAVFQCDAAMVETPTKATEAEISFRDAIIGRNLLCEEAMFGRLSTFRSLKCGHNAVFKGARFKAGVDLRFLEIGRNLDLTGTCFAEEVHMGQIQVSKKLKLVGANIRGKVELYDSTIDTLELWDPNHPERLPPPGRSEKQLEKWKEPGQGAKARKEAVIDDLFPFKMQNDMHLTGVNLTGTTFERFHGGPEDELEQKLAMELANEQDPAKFSIDPFLQLRNHYARIGDQATARKTRVCGYKRLRENARNPIGRTHWPLQRWVAEYLFHMWTNYGYRVWVVPLFIFALFTCLGTFLFWPTGALESAARGVTPPVEASHAFWHRLFERLAFSVDLLIPALNLRFETMWVPVPVYLSAYATFHSIAGWIVVALILGWLSGIIRPRD
jgi:uncharacterized protein YjbI with pentapeptide repeats